ncbi:MAG: hypothetical protein LBD88_01875 [Candidatus Peribacteria bacterium]|nr:hypothetical protein [Candidatus Peribacteria bacterium]
MFSREPVSADENSLIERIRRQVKAIDPDNKKDLSQKDYLGKLAAVSIPTLPSTNPETQLQEVLVNNMSDIKSLPIVIDFGN